MRDLISSQLYRIFLFGSLFLLFLTFAAPAQITNWSPRPSYLGKQSTYVAYGNGLLVASYTANLGQIMDTTSLIVSSNGQDWTRRLLPLSLTNGIYNIRFANGQFFTMSKPMLSSPDAINWAVLNTPSLTPQRILFGNGKYALLGANAPSISVSTNTSDWSSPIPFDASIGDLAFGAGLFVGSSQSGAVISQDAIHWSYVPSNVATNITSGICYGNGMFVGSGRSGSIYKSADGLNWQEAAPMPPFFGGIFYGLGNFFCLPYADTNVAIASSSNLTSWTTINLPSSSYPASATSTATSIFAVGSPPFFESNPIAAPTNSPTSLAVQLHPGLRVTGDIGARYRIEYTDDPAQSNWQTATELFLQTNPTTWVDPQPASAKRFYRSVRLD
jgi:hypothetical protein